MEVESKVGDDNVFKHVEDIDKDGLLRNSVLIDSPLIVLTVLIFYLAFVLRLGPALMSSRPPFKMTMIMRAFNLGKVLYNSWVVYLSLIEPDTIPYLINHSCHPPDIETVDHLRKLFLRIAWHFVVLKLLELADTVFMVLRKKTAHITYLHLYHHSAVTFISWFCTRFMLSQQAAIPGILNMSLNVVIHSYYFLATFGPRFQWIVKRKWILTALQLVQFLTMMVYLGALYFHDCEVSRGFALLWLLNLAVIVGFFLNFFIRSFILGSGKGHSHKEYKNS